MGERQADPALVIGVSEEHGAKVGGGVPGTAVCGARPQVPPRARVHAACLWRCRTRRFPLWALLWVPLGALARDPSCRHLSGGRGGKGGGQCSPGGQAAVSCPAARVPCPWGIVSVKRLGGAEPGVTDKTPCLSEGVNRGWLISSRFSLHIMTYNVHLTHMHTRLQIEECFQCLKDPASLPPIK